MTIELGLSEFLVRRPDFKDNLPNVFTALGLHLRGRHRPVLVGEFGAKLIDGRDVAWLDELTQYMNSDFNTDGVDRHPDAEG